MGQTNPFLLYLHFYRAYPPLNTTQAIVHPPLHQTQTQRETILPTMNNIHCIRFSIPDQVSAEAAFPSPDPYSPKPDLTACWTCTLTKLGDNTIRAALHPPALHRTDHENEKSGQRHCSNVQILATSFEVLVAKNVSRFDFSKQGVDCKFLCLSCCFWSRVVGRKKVDR